MANETRTRSLLRSRGIQLLIVVVVAATVAIIFLASRTKATTYFTSPVKTGNITSMVQATGVVNPIHTISIGAQISGKILKINVDFNSVVKKGELIAQIDPSVYQISLDSAKADLANSNATVTSSIAQEAVAEAAVATAKAAVAKADANVAMASAQKDRTVGLFQQGIVAASQRDTDVDTFLSDQADVATAQAGLAQSVASLKAAQATIDQSKAVVQEKVSEVETAQTNLDYCNIYAPVDGVIVDRAVDMGQTVASSLQTPTLFSEATDLNTMWVYMQTDESDEGRLTDGEDATFTVDAYPNTIYHGSVQQRRMFATTVSNVVEYDTIIQFNNAGQRVFPGMTAYVNVPVASARNVLEVPNSALRFKPNLTPVALRAKLAQYGMEDAGAPPAAAPAGGGRSGGGTRGGHGGGAGAVSNRPTTALIWTLDADQELKPVRVRTGITDFTYTAITQVLQGSLRSGDQVVTGALIEKSVTGLPGATAPPRGGR